MLVYYRFITCVMIATSFFSGFAYAASSTGSNPGFSFLPTTFEWEGDRILNNEDTSDLFDEIKNGIPDDFTRAGMVLNSTGEAVNNTTMVNHTVNNTTPSAPYSDDYLSGYASVGDIIKAHDWTALQRYTSGIQATTEMTDSSLFLENRNNNWDNHFKEPLLISCGPC